MTSQSRSIPRSLLSSAALLCLLGACSTPAWQDGSGASALSASGPANSPVAVARLLGPDGKTEGQVELRPAAQGVDFSVRAEGLSPGAHGLHVHANGACAPGPDPGTGRVVDFGAAGGHFDPGSSHNHGRPGDDAAIAHAGELPALQADAQGRASLRYTNAQLSLQAGPRSVIGRTVVVHADPDDYVSDPAGNAGARVLCGVIEAFPKTGSEKSRATLEGAQVYPEGIAVDPRSGDAYVGSSVNGDLFRIRSGAAQGELLQAGGAVGRQGAFGMKLDAQGRLWIAGGPNGTLAAVDPATATTLAVFKVPADAPSFLNDLAIAPDGSAFVTDSFRPILWRIRTQAAGTTTLEPWLDLRTTAIRYQPNEINLNGIVVSPDGRQLLAVQLASGMLWRIDTQTRRVARVPVDGGDLNNGDGLLLAGPYELLVVRNVDNEVLRLQLDSAWNSARIVQRLREPRFNYPTTAALSPNGLMVVNSQLDRQKVPPPLLPFDVLTLEFPR